MIIDSPNELKQWLTGYLPPLCDADPEVLAKYCLALVKKDRPDEELKASLIEQLDVFLKSNTGKFVEKFLEVAGNKSYMSKDKSSPAKSLTGDDATKVVVSHPNSPVRISAIDPPSTTTTTITTGLAEKAVSTPASDPSSQPPLPPLPPPVQSIPYPPPETTPPYPPPKKEEFSSATKASKSEPKEREREERRGRRGSRPRDKSRSRSRERDRNRRSRSRGRSNRSKYDDRRRRSPHRGTTLKSRYSRRSRSRSRSPRWSRSPNRRSRSRDRRSRSRNRSRSLSPKKHQSRHKSRSRTPKPVSRAESPVSSSRKTPSKEEKEGSSSPNPNPGETQGPPPLVLSVVSIPHQERYTASKAQRCRDYDEQGFCMKGDQCPFDHGADPVVLEGGTIDFPPPLSGVPALTSVPGIGYPLSGPSLPRDIPGRSFLRHPPPPRPAQFGEYTPNNPGLWGSEPPPPNPFYGGRGRGMAGPPPRFPGPPPPLGPHEIGRELISVPVNGTNPGKTGIRASLAQRLGPTSAMHLHLMALSSHGAPKFPNAFENCTLELRKIPNGLNTISHLNQHFAKFGTIINIQNVRDKTNVPGGSWTKVATNTR